MDIKTWIVNNISPASIIIEAGAYDGNDTLFLSEVAHRGAVYSFEPIPDLYSISNSRIFNKPNVKLFNKALSDKNAKEYIYLSDRFGSNWGSSSFLKPKEHLDVHPQITFKSKIEIDCVNLDTFCDIQDISVVDFMWLDMQGYEPVVLFSAPLTLSKTKYIYTEVSLIETYENVMLYPEFRAKLLDLGFEVVFEELPWVDMGNVLFKNTKINYELTEH